MLQTFSKYAGVIQTLLGLSGQFVPAIGSAIGTATGGNTFNIVSGIALSYLGYKGTPGALQATVPALSGLNGLAGILGFTSLMPQGTLSNVINLAIAAWGLYARFAKKPQS